MIDAEDGMVRAEVTMRPETDPVAVDWPAIYRRHWRPLLRLAQGLVDDPATAEDVVQDAFAGLFGRASSLRDPAAYLRTSVVNGARSALRRRRTVRARLHLVHDDHAEPGADEIAVQHDAARAVRAALATLPHRQREVLALRLLGELTDLEIVAATGLSHGNVRSAASRGLATLRNALKETS